MPSKLLYDELVRITYGYLGPATERFLNRQIRNHLHKTPEELTKKDLLKLIDWIKIGMSVLTDDSELIEEYETQLRKLSSVKPAKKGKNND